MAEAEELIAAVKKRDFLWNPNAVGYTNRELSYYTWEQIVDEVWRDEDGTDTKERVIELKKKWSNIRDYYKRLMHDSKYKRRSEDTKRKKYIYSDLLTFLDPVLEKWFLKSSSEHGDSLPREEEEEEEEEDEVELEIKKEDDPIEVDFVEEDQNVLESAQNQNYTQQNRNIYNGTDTRPVWSNPRGECRENASNNSSKLNNSNTSFLMSFVQEMDEMTPYQRIDFKCGMMDLLRKVKYPRPPH